MAEGGITYELAGTKEILEVLDKNLDPKTVMGLIKSTNRKALNEKIVKPLRGAIPYSSLKKSVGIVADKEHKPDGYSAGIMNQKREKPSVPPPGIILRFMEYGTKVRTTRTGANRGSMPATPRVRSKILGSTNGVIDFFNKDFGQTLVALMQRKLKRII